MLMLRRLTTFAALLGTAFLVATLVAPGTASAAQQCWMQAVKGSDGSIHYVKVCRNVDPGDPGGGGGGGGPTCDIAAQGPPLAGYSAWYCSGRAVCASRENIVPLAPPSTPAPPGQQWVRQDCWPCGGCLGPPSSTLVLSGAVARPLIVQAQEAFGNLAPPTGTVRHSPDDEAVVHLDTWLWLDPGTFGRLTGSSAEGLVAVAEPAETTWRPGDGSSLTCAGAGTPYGSGAGAGCTHVYTKASPAYHGTVTRQWAVHYENGGATVTIPGAPAVLTAVTAFDLTVVETQVLTD
jgi:hypothetical protein